MTTSLKADANTYCKLYVGSQTRSGNIAEFFSHENNRYPPSISDFGKLRHPACKSDILPCIENFADIKNENFDIHPEVGALIIDGPALVHMLPPGSSKTFNDYSANVFVAYIKERLKQVKRIDIVFDRYDTNSLKTETRLLRGTGQKIMVTPTTRIPVQFKKFLAVNENKQELFRLLAKDLAQLQLDGKTIVCTFDEDVVTSSLDLNISEISPCTQEEADGRLLLHVKHAVSNSITKVAVKTVDSDVVVIALSCYHKITNIQELWIEYGKGKDKRHLPIHKLSPKMPSPLIESLPFFHSFTGCDTVSAFLGIGKRSAWNAWMMFRDIDEIFIQLGNLTQSSFLSDQLPSDLERFVCLMYDRTSSTSSVNECRRILFTKRNRDIQNIPPTLDALTQHTKRAALQASIWNRCLQSTPEVYNPEDWGWRSKTSGFEPIWTTLPDVSQHCKELISCSCKKRCINCKCVKHNLQCTQLCCCDGHCSRQD